MSNVFEFPRKEIRALHLAPEYSLTVCLGLDGFVFVLDRASRGLQGYQAPVGNQDHRLALLFNHQKYIQMQNMWM